MADVIHLHQMPQRRRQEARYKAFRKRPESGYEAFGYKDVPDLASPRQARKADELQVRAQQSSSFAAASFLYFRGWHGLILGTAFGLWLGFVDREATADMVADARHQAAQCSIAKPEPYHAQVVGK